MLLPSGSKQYDVAPGSVTFTLTGHTAALPRIAIMKRKLPDANGYSTYSVKLVRGVAQVDGTVKNAIFELSVRNVKAQVAGDSTALVAALNSIIDSANFASDVGTTLALPGATDVTP